MTSNKTVTVGDEEIRLEPFSGRKAIRVVRVIEHITQGIPDILDRWADFTREYEARNVTVMDRATARNYYRAEPLTEEVAVLGADDAPIMDGEGGVLVRRRPLLGDDGGPVMGPDPLGHLTDQDWAASNNQLRLPKSPGMGEQIAAVFPMALKLAEDEVTQLLALLAMPNADLKRKARDGSLKDYLGERAEDLLDAPATDLLELAVTAGEMVEDQFTSKVRELGDRLPNALRLFGINLKSLTETNETSKNSSSETKPTSSTDSPPPTDGTSEQSSTVPDGSSSEPSPIV